MSKKISLNFTRIIAFFVFCCIFVASMLIFLRISKNAEENTESPPETTPYKYSDFPTVIIDAGHGGEDGGAIGIDGTYEKDLNLSIALELEALLRAEGIKTRLTRDTDTLLYDRNSNYKGHKKAQDAAARIAIAEEYENAIFISIHMNTFSQSKYKGLQVYYSENSPLSTALAHEVQTYVAANLQQGNTRKIKPAGDNIYIMQKLKIPSILIECGFISNPEECALLDTSEYRSRLCMCFFSAIVNYFENSVDNS